MLHNVIGPSPRLLVRFGRNPSNSMLAHFQQKALAATNRLTTLYAALKDMPIEDQDQHDGFHHFFFMTAFSRSDDLSASETFTHRVGTPWLLRILRSAICAAQDKNDNEILRGLSGNSTVYGIAFEALLLRRIKDGRVSNSYSTNGPSEFALSQVVELDSLTPNKFYREVYLDRNGSLPALTGAAQFFVTVSPNFPTLDAVVVTTDRIVLLQLTVAARHQMRQAGLQRVHQLMDHNNFLQGRQWHFVFVTPRDGIGAPRFRHAKRQHRSSTCFVSTSSRTGHLRARSARSGFPRWQHDCAPA